MDGTAVTTGRRVRTEKSTEITVFSAHFLSRDPKESKVFSQGAEITLTIHAKCALLQIHMAKSVTFQVTFMHYLALFWRFPDFPADHWPRTYKNQVVIIGA